jgi:hypothetical protein
MSTSETAASPIVRAVTKSDTTELKITLSDGSVRWPRSLYVGGGGDVAILAASDTAAVTLSSVPAGTILPVKAAKVMSTNTTATNIVALY